MSAFENAMKKMMLIGWAALLTAGCLSTAPADNPLVVQPEPGRCCENPVLISPGQPSPTAYAEVFEKVLDVVENYFEIAYANRYDGRIIAKPKIAPGLEQPWKPGSPDSRDRLLAWIQTIRYRCIVQIRSAEQGGYLVQVTVYKELEDNPKPTILANTSVFRDTASVDRSFETVDSSTPPEERWIPKGREYALEDAILKKIRRCQFE